MPLDLSGGQTVTVTTGLSGYLADIKAAYDKAHGMARKPLRRRSLPVLSLRPTMRSALGYGTSGSALTLRLTYLGDADLSGAVTPADIAAMTPMSTGGTWATGDFNYDGAVNADDFALAQLGALKSNGANITALVPEPASLAFIALRWATFWVSRPGGRANAATERSNGPVRINLRTGSSSLWRDIYAETRTGKSAFQFRRRFTLV